MPSNGAITTNAAAAPATLYTVTSPRNTYYAVRSHATGMIWTERTESAAQAMAAEQGLRVVEEQEITQAALRELIVVHEREAEDRRSAADAAHPGQDRAAAPDGGRPPGAAPRATVHASVVQRFVNKFLGRSPARPGAAYADHKG